MQECLDSKAQLAAAQQAKEGLHYETFEPGMAFFVILAVLVILIIVLTKIGLLGTLVMAAGKVAKTAAKTAYEMSPKNDIDNKMTEAFAEVKTKSTGEVNKEVNKMGGKLVERVGMVAGGLVDMATADHSHPAAQRGGSEGGAASVAPKTYSGGGPVAGASSAAPKAKWQGWRALGNSLNKVREDISKHGVTGLKNNEDGE
jgi:hypothetical protein